MASLAVIEDRPIGNVEAEMAVIGAMLCESKVIDHVADRLNADDFSERFLGFVYGTILREYALGRALNPVTLRPLLEREPAYAELGGWGWLAQLGQARVTALAATSSASQIKEMAQRRRLIEGLRETIAAAADYEQPIEKLVERADEAVSLAREGEDSRGEYSGADCVKMVIDGFDQPISGVTCGNILSIDQLLGPMRAGHFVVWAGRPGMGKTATAISYALGAAAKGHGVLFISLEMPADELGERMAADLCFDQHRIPYEAITSGKLSAEQKRIICRAQDYLQSLPLQVVDKAGITPSQLRAITRRWKRRFEAKGKKLELVIVDYIQRMRAPGDGAYERVSEISRSSKDLAKEEKLTVCALAQLSREVEKRADKRPILADLRDSGQIEQDADTVLFFLRDEYYLLQTKPDDGHESRAKWDDLYARAQGRIEFICAKRRRGTTGALKGEFLGPYQAVRG
jgi:replicative DNA helicase